MFWPQLQMRTSAPAMTVEESWEAPHNSYRDWTFLRPHERVPEVPIRVKAGTSVILSRADMDLSVPRGFRRGVSPLSWGDMQVRSSLEMEKQHQISCWVEIGIGGFLSRCHRAVTPAIVF